MSAYQQVARLLHERLGLRVADSAKTRLERALRLEARAFGVSPEEYADRLIAEPALYERLVDEVTVQETAFFRNPAHFAALAGALLPRLDGPVVVWSAGCANGQEPYSIAMVLAESGLDDWSVVATDVSAAAVTRAQQAVYEERELGGVSAERRERHFERQGDRWRVSGELRERVSVRRHNLLTDAPPVAAGSCPVIFCRHVLIYFGPEEIVAALSRLEGCLAPDGHLFLGGTESIWQATTFFSPIHLDGGFAYRRLMPARDDAQVDARPARAPEPRPRRAAAAERAPAAGAPPVSRPARSEEARTAPRPEPAPLVPPEPEVDELVLAGERAAGAGDYAAAVEAFRKAAYLAPDNVMAAMNLALALEARGDQAGALRVFGAVRVSVDEPAGTGALKGFDVRELSRLLDHKLGGPR